MSGEMRSSSGGGEGLDLEGERWDRLAAGLLSPAEIDALRADPDPAVQVALAAFAPLDDGILTRLEALVRAAPRLEELPASAGEARGFADPPRPRRGRIWGAALVAAGLAAALGLWWTRPVPPALPAYVLELEGGDQALRDPTAAEGPPSFRADSLISLTLRPAVAVAPEALAWSVWLVTPGEPRPAPVTLVAHSKGALTFDGPAGALFEGLPAGEYTLRVELARVGGGPPQRLERVLRWRP